VLEILLISSKSVICLQIFIQDHNIKFHRDSNIGKRSDSSFITDGPANVMKLIGVFHDCKMRLNTYMVVPTLFPSPNALSTNMFKLFINFLFSVNLLTISSLSSTMFQTL